MPLFAAVTLTDNEAFLLVASLLAASLLGIVIAHAAGRHSRDPDLSALRERLYCYRLDRDDWRSRYFDALGRNQRAQAALSDSSGTDDADSDRENIVEVRPS